MTAVTAVMDGTDDGSEDEERRLVAVIGAALVGEQRHYREVVRDPARRSRLHRCGMRAGYEQGVAVITFEQDVADARQVWVVNTEPGPFDWMAAGSDLGALRVDLD